MGVSSMKLLAASFAYVPAAAPAQAADKRGDKAAALKRRVAGPKSAAGEVRFRVVWPIHFPAPARS
jgi:hypothetical protein